MKPKYQFTPEMGEISGLGGTYEETCRAMLAAGLEWLDAHPGKTIETGKTELEDAIAGQIDDTTGAQMRAVMMLIRRIKETNWEHFCTEAARHNTANIEKEYFKQPFETRGITLLEKLHYLKQFDEFELTLLPDKKFRARIRKGDRQVEYTHPHPAITLFQIHREADRTFDQNNWFKSFRIASVPSNC
jgi:hypothetical protein